MTEQCKLCGTERIDEEEFCHKSGCGYHFESQPTPDWLSQGMDSYQKQPDKEEVKQEPPENPPQPSYHQSETEWEKNRKEMQKEQEESEPTIPGSVATHTGEKGILVLPDGEEIPITANIITIGRSNVDEYVEFKLGENVMEVSSQQFTIWQEDGHYFIEDRVTSVQKKQSANHTKLNGDDITGHLKQELHDNDKIEFAHIEKCVATFQLR